MDRPGATWPRAIRALRKLSSWSGETARCRSPIGRALRPQHAVTGDERGCGGVGTFEHADVTEVGELPGPAADIGDGGVRLASGACTEGAAGLV